MDCRAASPTGRYTLRFGFNAFAAFEAEAGRSAFQTIAEMERGTLVMATDLRLMCWAAMLHHHSQATLEEAGHLLDADPTCVVRALSVAMPDTEAGGSDTGKKLRAMFLAWGSCCAHGLRRVFRSSASGR